MSPKVEPRIGERGFITTKDENGAGQHEGCCSHVLGRLS